jgi:phosphocarrier protein
VRLTQLAAKYQCNVSLARKGRMVNAKSLMGVMMLAAGKGSRVMLETDGPDEIEALGAIVTLIGGHSGEAQ